MARKPVTVWRRRVSLFSPTREKKEWGLGFCVWGGGGGREEGIDW